MKIIVDTSAWSLAFRRKHSISNPSVQRLKELIDNGEDIFLLGVIVLELLTGIRDKNQFEKLKNVLSAFPLIELSQDDYFFAAELRNQCLSKGIQGSTIDFLIAATAIRYDAYLFTIDGDFKNISTVVSLKCIA